MWIVFHRHSFVTFVNPDKARTFSRLLRGASRPIYCAGAVVQS